MQGYGRRTSGRRRVRVAWSAAVALVLGMALACANVCSIVSELTLPDESRTIVIPGTNALTTESSVAATSTSSADGPDDDGGDDAAPGAWDDYSYGHVISVAPRADAQRFHRAAKTSSAALITTSGYHFSSPDRAIQCSTGANGTGTLACTSQLVHGSPTPPPGTPASCRWNPEMVTLGPAAPSAGACANLYPIMARSTILPFGQTLAVGRFKCLNSVEGMYCLQSTGTGFAITKAGFREIRGDERAPRAMRGSAPDERDERPTSTRPTS